MRALSFTALLAVVIVPWGIGYGLQSLNQGEPRETLESMRFDLVKTVGPMAFVMDYDLTIGDCVSRWADFPATDKLSCELAGSVGQ